MSTPTADVAPLAHQISGPPDPAPPVVLLNGGMMTYASWEGVAERLRGRYRVLAFDFRGQLLSPGEAPLDLAAHAADVADLMDQVGWESAHLVGTSFGAEVALELAAARPERARSLVAITAMDRSTPGLEEGSETMRAILAELGTPSGGEARERFWDVMVEGVYSAAYREREAAMLASRRAQLSILPATWFAGVDRLLGAVENFDLTAKLPAVRCPALVVSAAGDRVMDPERSAALARALGAETAVHPTSGHGLVAEDPEWLAEVVLDFLDRIEAGAG
jgi:3-oxoadipate enol-lactonase